MKETKESTIKEESFGTKVSETIEKETEKLKHRFNEKAESIAISESQKEAIQALLEEAISQAFLLGKVSKTDFPPLSKDLIDKFEEIYKQMTEPTAATRADKYKQLYYNQRIITAHMQSQIQILQM